MTGAPTPPPSVPRRAVLIAAVAAAAAAVGAAPVPPAAATVEYAGVPFLGGSEVVDINNANVRAFMKYPGMYPTLAGKIATHGPYASVEDVMNIPGLTSAQKDLLNKYKGKMVALRPTPEYVRWLDTRSPLGLVIFFFAGRQGGCSGQTRPGPLRSSRRVYGGAAESHLFQRGLLRWNVGRVWLRSFLLGCW